MDRELARELVTALAPIDRPVALGDELTRTEARLGGWTGPLAPLTPPGPMPPGGVAVVPPLAVVQDLLPGVDVSRRGFGRTVLHLRVVAADGGFRMRLKVPDRSDLMPEIVAAALDTAFAIRRRYGRMAAVCTITIDDGAGGMDDHMTAGSTEGGSGTIYLETSLAFADALGRPAPSRWPAGVSAEVRPWFHIDGVVAHEIWHNMDATVATTPGVTSSSTRALGEELGVETFEHALRGRDAGVPEPWAPAGFPSDRRRGVALRNDEHARGDRRAVQAVCRVTAVASGTVGCPVRRAA